MSGKGITQKFGAFVLSVFLTGVISAPLSAYASGFLCVSVDQDTQIEVYFSSASSELEEPPVERMEIKDLMVSPRHQLIAKFHAADGVLSKSGNTIVAHVDLSLPDSSRRGERVGGTVLGALRSIQMEIDFSYQEPVQDGTRFAALVTYLKRNGEELAQDFDCNRYSDPKKMQHYLAHPSLLE